MISGFSINLTSILRKIRPIRSVIGVRSIYSQNIGEVYFVATPIGNLDDISTRACNILSKVDIICAEDTRHTIKLLRSLHIPPKELISHHQHNWIESIPKIMSLVKSGRSIAVVSDAGTPCISDPGAELAAACIAEGIPIHPIPGPSAVTTALSVSGFSVTPFTFLGFLPPRGSEKEQALRAIAACEHAVVFFEAPHRIEDTLSDLCSLSPISFSSKTSIHLSTFSGLPFHPQSPRLCSVSRELTKVHEQHVRGEVRQVLGRLRAMGEKGGGERTSEDSQNKGAGDGLVKGEFTVVLGPVKGGGEGLTWHSSISSNNPFEPHSKEEKVPLSTLASTSSEFPSPSPSLQGLVLTRLMTLRADGLSRSEAVGLVTEMLPTLSLIIMSNTQETKLESLVNKGNKVADQKKEKKKKGKSFVYQIALAIEPW